MLKLLTKRWRLLSDVMIKCGKPDKGGISLIQIEHASKANISSVA